MKPQILTDMLRSIRRDNPSASEMEIRNLCRDKVFLEAELQTALFDYWFSNSFRDFVVTVVGPHETVVNRTASSPSPIVRRASPSSASVAAKAALVATVKVEIASRLMEFVLADGTQLRFATFGQCQREGNWLAAVGMRGKANEVVGKKLTEVDLFGLWERFNGKRRAG